MRLELELALRIVSEANRRDHWSKAARRASEQRSFARMAMTSRLAGTLLRTAIPPEASRMLAPAGPLVVTLTRVAPRELDGDNLQRALKAVRDGIADALGVDDRDPRVTWQYGQARGAAKRYAVRITIDAPR
jgi:hypothetical protein